VVGVSYSVYVDDVYPVCHREEERTNAVPRRQIECTKSHRIGGSHSSDYEEFCLHFSDTISIQNDLKQGDASLSFLLNFALEYAVMNVLEDQQEVQFNGTHQPLVYVVSYWSKTYTLFPR
jgi:hypothetical protein